MQVHQVPKSFSVSKADEDSRDHHAVNRKDGESEREGVRGDKKCFHAGVKRNSPVKIIFSDRK